MIYAASLLESISRVCCLWLSFWAHDECCAATSLAGCPRSARESLGMPKTQLLHRLMSDTRYVILDGTACLYKAGSDPPVMNGGGGCRGNNEPKQAHKAHMESMLTCDSSSTPSTTHSSAAAPEMGQLTIFRISWLGLSALVGQLQEGAIGPLALLSCGRHQQHA